MEKVFQVIVFNFERSNKEVVDKVEKMFLYMINKVFIKNIGNYEEDVLKEV